MIKNTQTKVGQKTKQKNNNQETANANTNIS